MIQKNSYLNNRESEIIISILLSNKSYNNVSYDGSKTWRFVSICATCQGGFYLKMAQTVKNGRICDKDSRQTAVEDTAAENAQNWPTEVGKCMAV